MKLSGKLTRFPATAISDLLQMGARLANGYGISHVDQCTLFLMARYIGVPHKSIEDDIYNGMFIPKG